MSTGYQIRDQSALHYLTFQIVDWIDVFTRQRYRDIVIDSLRYCQQNKGLQIFGKPEDYIYSSASNYAEKESILEVYLIHFYISKPGKEKGCVIYFLHSLFLFPKTKRVIPPCGRNDILSIIYSTIL